MIRKASYSDIPPTLEITKACARHMISKGIYQWNSHYPNEGTFKIDIKRGELYVLSLNNVIVGCVVISKYMDDEYVPIKWLTTSSRNLYIHRLAVRPEYQGKGYAQKLIDFAENYGRTNKFHSIRLDTFSKNIRNQKFYEQRGYKRLGNIYFPKQSEHPFYCYELIL